MMHELIRAAAIFALCAGALLVASPSNDGDISPLGAAARTLTSASGLAGSLLLGVGVAGLTNQVSMIGIALALLVGLIAGLALSILNFRAKSRRPSAKPTRRAGRTPARASKASDMGARR